MFLLNEDVEENPNQVEQAQPEGNQTNVEDEASYLPSPEQLQAQQMTNDNSNSTDSQKTLKLFDLSRDLFDYAEVLQKNLENIDNDFIAVDVVVYLSQLEDTLSRYKSKLRDFIAEVFYKETYEKNLYTYLTLRYELLSMVKYLRSLLKLDDIPVDDSDNDNTNVMRRQKTSQK